VSGQGTLGELRVLDPVEVCPSRFDASDVMLDLGRNSLCRRPASPWSASSGRFPPEVPEIPGRGRDVIDHIPASDDPLDQIVDPPSFCFIYVDGYTTRVSGVLVFRRGRNSDSMSLPRAFKNRKKPLDGEPIEPTAEES